MNVRQRFGREAIKAALRPMLRWRPMRDPIDGFSIVLGSPWALAHLVEVNLRFVAKTDLTGLDKIFVVYDRPYKDGMHEEATRLKAMFPELPLEVLHYPPLVGKLVERVNVSTFYNSTNTVLALSQARTRYVVLHDFDLYPIVPKYFRALAGALRENDWHFTGIERTYFDGLTDDDNILGTWSLTMDAQWVRDNWRPTDCFHKIAPVNGRETNLDPYSYIQTKTPKRGLAPGVDGDSCCHVRNLCSTYLRFRSGRRPNVVWRLHYLWYLETHCGKRDNFDAATTAMQQADSPVLRVGDYEVDFDGVHRSCAEVLGQELDKMEQALFGQTREEVKAFVDAFDSFLTRHGDTRPVEELGTAETQLNAASRRKAAS